MSDIPRCANATRNPCFDWSRNSTLTRLESLDFDPGQYSPALLFRIINLFSIGLSRAVGFST